MATIVENRPETTLNPGESLSIIGNIWHFILNNFFWIALLIIIAIAIGVIIVLVFINEERKKEQEDMLYKEYKNTISSCKQNRQPKMYTQRWSKWNLLFLGLPLIKYKIGRKIRDKHNEFVAYYDGLYVDDLANYNLLVWKKKAFIFFKDHFVIRVPTQAYSITPEQNEETKEVKFNVGKHTLPKGLITRSDYDNTITIQMEGLKKNGFYYYPVYSDRDGRILNLQESINAMNHINHSNELLINVIQEGGKAVLGMAKQNTGLVYEQKKPEKVREVEAES